MDKYIKIKYLGKTKLLELTLRYLSQPYTFDQETGSIATMLYDDAKALLEENPKGFKVVSNVIEGEEEEVELTGQQTESNAPDTSNVPAPEGTGAPAPDKPSIYTNIMAMNKEDLVRDAKELLGITLDPTQNILKLKKQVKDFIKAAANVPDPPDEGAGG